MATPRSRVGPYTLLEPLASGGGGTVYRAETAEGGAVAVKVLDARLTEPSDVRRFMREGSLRLEHPNVVRTLDAGTDPTGAPYLVLELLEGESLAARLKRGRVSPVDAVSIGVQVCRGLEAAHAARVIHRDLKPGNVFLCTDGTVKILDFGIALFTTDVTRMTTTGMVVGTPSYVAPEQARGDATLDERVDVWGLGAVLYEAITGRAPFDRETTLATVLAILREPHLPTTSAAPRTPPALGAVVDRCLAKARGDRWPSVEALRRALEALPADVAEPEASGALALASFPEAEQRVVAVLLAQGALDAVALEAAVERWGGAFVPLAGHRAVGLFGGAAWEGDELERAAHAALDARRGAASVAVSLGTASKTAGSISGEALTAAERGCKAHVGGVAIARDAARALSRRFVLREVTSEVCEIVGRAPGSALPPAVEQPASLVRWSMEPRVLVGRDAELARLRGAVDAATQDEQGALVVITGPPGVGKSRLRAEAHALFRRACPDGPRFTARAEATDRPRPGAFAARLLARHAQELPPAGVLDPGSAFAGAAELARRLAREVGALGAPDAGLAERLAGLLGMPHRAASDATLTDLEVAAEERVASAVVEYFTRLVELAPVGVFLDDLQWADPWSRDALAAVLEAAGDRGLLVVASCQSWWLEEQRDVFVSEGAITLRPRELVPEEVHALVEAVCGRAVPRVTSEAIAARTGGNPLFVEQIALELLAEGTLDAAAAALPLPVSVRAAVQARVDHLPALERRACLVAARLGRPFTAAELEALGVVDASALLEGLVRRGILAATVDDPDGAPRAYRFRSALLGDVAAGLAGTAADGTAADGTPFGALAADSSD